MLNYDYLPAPTCSIYAADRGRMLRRTVRPRVFKPSKRPELRYKITPLRVNGESIFSDASRSTPSF